MCWPTTFPTWSPRSAARPNRASIVHQAGRQHLGRHSDHHPGGNYGGCRRGPSPQRPHQHPFQGRRFHDGGRQGRSGLDYARRLGHRGRAIRRRRSRSAHHAHHDLPFRGLAVGKERGRSDQELDIIRCETPKTPLTCYRPPAPWGSRCCAAPTAATRR